MKRIKTIAFIFAMTFSLVAFGCKNPVRASGPDEPGDPENPVGLTFTGTDYTELPSTVGGTLSERGTYVDFGDWPQTLKSGDVSVDESKNVTVGAYVYYYGSDGKWYAEFDGRYYKVEPIRWRVLTDDYNGKKLLLSEKVLINCKYYDYHDVDRRIVEIDVHPNNYKESRVRAFLNGITYQVKQNLEGGLTNAADFRDKGFLQTAFTEELRLKIVDTNVDNGPGSTNPASDSDLWNEGANENICANTSDKIFLLSEKDVTNSSYGFLDYSVSDAGRIRNATDFSKANGVSQSGVSGNGAIWLLRSPFYGNTYDVHEVAQDGLASMGDRGVVNDRGGIVPALCIGD